MPTEGDDLLDYRKLRELREALGLTQGDAANRAGFEARQTWNNIECGRQTAITLGTLAKLARAVECSPRELIRDVRPRKRRVKK